MKYIAYLYIKNVKNVIFTHKNIDLPSTLNQEHQKAAITMQTARKLSPQTDTPMNDSQHSSRLKNILLDRTYSKKTDAVDISFNETSIESRLEAENELEQALIKMFGYQ